MKGRRSYPMPRKSPKPSTVPRELPKTRVRSRQIARIVDDDQASLLDLVDNLLNKGVMLNADLVLALADVDLVYVRLSALLCAADSVFVLPRHGARDR